VPDNIMSGVTRASQFAPDPGSIPEDSGMRG